VKKPRWQIPQLDAFKTHMSFLFKKRRQKRHGRR